MDTNGWKDGKFDPDSQEPDYDFMFGKKEPEVPPEVAKPANPTSEKAQNLMRKVALKVMWESIRRDATAILVDENGDFFLKSATENIAIVNRGIKEK